MEPCVRLSNLNSVTLVTIKEPGAPEQGSKQTPVRKIEMTEAEAILLMLELQQVKFSMKAFISAGVLQPSTPPATKPSVKLKRNTSKKLVDTIVAVAFPSKEKRIRVGGKSAGYRQRKATSR